MRNEVRDASRATPLVALALLWLCAACDGDPAQLTLDLDGPATADPLVFHGNCLAGWSVGVTLRVQETGGADAWLDRLDYDLTDVGSGEEIRTESLDAPSLVTRYGTNVVEGRGALLLPLSSPHGQRPVGPIVVAGDLRGHDEHTQTFVVPFRLQATALVVRDPEPSPGGACS